MKILYLHGYKGKPNKRRIKYLEEMGFEVIAPYINYDKHPNVIENYKDIDYNYVIGNSLGGYVGFYLSEYKKIPSILINPPLYMNLNETIGLNIVFPEITTSCLETQTVILGSDDDIVEPKQVIEWLTTNKPHCVNVDIIEDMGHKYTKKQFIDFLQEIIKKW